MRRLITSIIMLSAFNQLAYANNISSLTPSLKSESFSVATSLGILDGKSTERVYDAESGKKVSQLDWKIKNTPILKGELNWDAWQRLTLNAKGWTSLASRSSTMDDYDWLDDSKSGLTDRSHHSNTRLNYANEFDLSLRGWLLKADNYKLAAVAGYQQTRFSWSAYGGDYNYDNGTNIGSFPEGKRTIGYQQQFSLPYIGFAGQYLYQGIVVNTLLKFSDWVTAKDNDEHYLRDTTFLEKTTNSRYYSAAIEVGYYITPNAKVSTEFAYNYYSEGKGGSEMINHDTGKTEYSGGDSAGIKNENYIISAGVQYRF